MVDEKVAVTPVKVKRVRVKQSVESIVSTGKGSMSFRFGKPELVQLIEKKMVKSSDMSDDVYRSVCEHIGISVRERNLSKAFEKIGVDPAYLLEYFKKNPKVVEGLQKKK